MQKFSSKTKTNSHRRSAKGSIFRRGVILIVVLALLLLFFRGTLGTLSAYVALPFYAVYGWAAGPFSDARALLDEKEELRARVETLEREKNEIALEAEALRATEMEITELRALLGAYEDERIAAGVTLRPGALPYDTFLIDRGRSDGVLVGAPVYAAGDTVVGSIARVYEHSALVTLVTSPGFVSTTYIYGPNIFTEAVGEGGGVLKVGVPQGIVLREGDVVVLPSIERGHFGTIAHIETSESSPEQYGYVTSDTALQSLRFVTVGKSAIEPITFEEVMSVVSEMENELFRIDVPEDVLISTSTPTSTESQSDEVETSS